MLLTHAVLEEFTHITIVFLSLNSLADRMIVLFIRAKWAG